MLADQAAKRMDDLFRYHLRRRNKKITDGGLFFFFFPQKIGDLVRELRSVWAFCGEMFPHPAHHTWAFGALDVNEKGTEVGAG